eukprot:maker-scaffold_5-snap-gene-10.65-mRNA-1 protein AED:0.37 eAED:0.46 QI:93/0.5/0.33/1/0/0/3/0/119
MDAAAQLPDHLKGEFFQILEELQVGDTLTLYNRITERCYSRCVKNFHSQKLNGAENQCLDTCVTKFMKMSQRIGQRYQEHQMKQSQQMQQQGQMPGAPGLRRSSGKQPNITPIRSRIIG